MDRGHRRDLPGWQLGRSCTAPVDGIAAAAVAWRTTATSRLDVVLLGHPTGANAGVQSAACTHIGCAASSSLPHLRRHGRYNPDARALTT
jgi:hypothetical protein